MDCKHANRTRPPYYSLSLLSAAALAYEILLMRLFSIIQWHHFAYMIISLALLGYGVSGTVLAVTQHLWRKRFAPVYLANLVLFGAFAVGSYLIAQKVPFNPAEVLWDPRQPLRLFLIYMLLTVPFVFAANGIALALACYREQLTRVYSVNLLGSGIGSLGVVVLLFVVFPLTALAAIGVLVAVAAVIALRELRVRRSALAAALAVAVTVPLIALCLSARPAISPYKGLSQTLQITGTRIINQRSSPLGLIDVVESPVVPLRDAPGLSLNAVTEPPPQLGVFTDGEGMTVITRNRRDRKPFSYLDQLTSALPYHLAESRRVLILGAGGGADVLQAWYHRVPEIHAVELNRQIVELVRNDYAAFAGHLWDADGVQVHIAEARGFVAGSRQRFDLIQIALLDSFSASSAGLYALNESYLYTVEALQEYMRHLAPDGFLAVTRWIKLPPRDTLKLFATAIDALKRSGAPDPERRLILIRGWQTGTLLVKNGVVTGREIMRLHRFCAERSFDLAYYPGMAQGEANRYNILARPYFFIGANALLGEQRTEFLDRYKFNLTPATDDRPYFFHFFKWKALPEMLALRGQGGMALLEWGDLLLAATLIQALIASFVLILLPIWFYRRRRPEAPMHIHRARVLVYFLAIGLAFLFLEIAFIQKLTLFLHHPLYAVAAVLTAFLAFAGLGSAWSKRPASSGLHRPAAGWAIGAIAGLSLMYIAVLPPIFHALIALPAIPKVAIAVALIAPLAFCMGIPFPLAMASVGAQAPALIPWAWGVNGCASVISAVLATLLAIHFGFTTVVLLALALYALAYLAFPQRSTVAAIAP